MNSSLSRYTNPNPEHPSQNKGRLFDHLQELYQYNGQKNFQQHQKHKNLYYKLVQKDQQYRNQKKGLERQINKVENQKVDGFWKNYEQQLQQRERKHRQQIESVRNHNNEIYAEKVQTSRSMILPEQRSNGYSLRDSYEKDVIEYEDARRHKRDIKAHLLEEGQNVYQFKKYQEALQKEKIVEQQKKKLQQDEQIQAKKQQYKDQWRKKYLADKNQQTFKIWDDTLKSKRQSQDALQNYIVNEGARALNERVYLQKSQIIEQQNAQRQEYIRELQKQLQQNQHRSLYDKQFERQKEKQMIEMRNKILQQKDELLRNQKKEEQKKYIEVLKAQHKPRVLKQEPDKVEYAGIGSPVHIGKIVGEDRRRQLEWLERSLNRDLAL